MITRRQQRTAGPARLRARPVDRHLGCWDGVAFCTPAIDALAGSVGEDWVIPDELVDAVLHEGLGEGVSPEERSFWHATYGQNYAADAELRVVEGGQHFLSASNPDDVNTATIEFVERWK